MKRVRINKKIKRIIDAIKPYDPERIYLIGSWARGEEDALSDVDLVLIKNTRLSFFNRMRELHKFLLADMGGVDILIYTPAEFSRMHKEGNAFIEMVIEEGALIYGG
jgi:predicted nucleotidyltransferase